MKMMLVLFLISENGVSAYWCVVSKRQRQGLRSAVAQLSVLVDQYRPCCLRLTGAVACCIYLLGSGSELFSLCVETFLSLNGHAKISKHFLQDLDEL